MVCFLTHFLMICLGFPGAPIMRKARLALKNISTLIPGEQRQKSEEMEQVLSKLDIMLCWQDSEKDMLMYWLING